MSKQTDSSHSRKASQGRGDSVSTAGSGKPHQVIKLGVDTQGAQYTFARMVDQQGSQPPQKLSPEAFLDFLKKQLKLADRVVLVYEAGPYGFDLARRARELGAECLVCVPERLSRGRKRVNDKIDAAELLSRLDRHLAGNRTALRLVAVPTIQQEIRRRLARERNTYRKERQRWQARGRSLLHTLGIHRPGRWWDGPRTRALLEQVCERYGQEVQQQVQAELNRCLEAMQFMAQKLGELSGCLEQAGKSRSAVRVKGIGHLSSELLDREIGDWGRFANRRQIASYSGLCPGEDSSGESQRSLSIDKHGNPRVRALLVELAWSMVRFQPSYQALARWKWVFESGSKAGRGLRKKAVVALARRLIIDLWRLATGRCRAEDLGLKLVT